MMRPNKESFGRMGHFNGRHIRVVISKIKSKVISNSRRDTPGTVLILHAKQTKWVRMVSTISTRALKQNPVHMLEDSRYVFIFPLWVTHLINNPIRTCRWRIIRLDIHFVSFGAKIII